MNERGPDDDSERQMSFEHSLESDSAEERTRKHDALIERLLSDPQKIEALNWLRQSGADQPRTIGGCESNQESIQMVEELYDFGALEVLALSIHPNPNGSGQHTGKLVVRLPQAPNSRRSLFDWCEGRGESLGFTPDPDRGETHLFLLLE